MVFVFSLLFHNSVGTHASIESHLSAYGGWGPAVFLYSHGRTPLSAILLLDAASNPCTFGTCSFLCPSVAANTVPTGLSVGGFCSPRHHPMYVATPHAAVFFFHHCTVLCCTALLSRAPAFRSPAGQVTCRLAVSRSLGDRQFKGQGGQPAGSDVPPPPDMQGQLVSPEPSVKSVLLEPQDRAVVVASGKRREERVRRGGNT